MRNSVNTISFCRKQLRLKLNVCVFLLFYIFTPLLSSAQVNISHLKAVMLLKFANNINWEDNAKKNNYRIGFVSDDTLMFNAMQYYSKSQRIHNKPFVIEQLSKPNYVVDILYIDNQQSQQISKIYTEIEDKPILLVSEDCGDKKYIMLNLLLDLKKKAVTFEVNKANILLQDLSYESELLLLGGTEIDVRELYRSMKDSLQNERKVVQKQRDTIAIQLRTMRVNQQNLEAMQRSMTEMQLQITAKEQALKALNEQTDIQYKSYSEQSHQIINQRILLDQIKGDLHRRKTQIKQQISKLRQLKRESFERSHIIKKQQDALSIKQSLIKTQNLLIFVFLIAGVLLLTLAIAILWLYRNKKTANTVLELKVKERTEQLQESNDLLRAEIRERIEVERELERHRNHLEILVDERTAELLCTNQELSAINEQLIATNETLAQQKAQLQEAMQKLQDAQTQLVQSEKMASLGFLTAGIAHEINNPLNYIKSGIEAHSVLHERFMNHIAQHKTAMNDGNVDSFDYDKLNRQFAQCSTNINSGIDRIVAIVRSLRLFSRADSNAIVSISIPETIEAALVMFATSIKNRITIHSSHQAIVIETYSEQIFQVIVNLLSNAIGACPKNGEIWIRSYLINNTTACIEVSDNGNGMTKEVKTKLFEPFFTTKKTGEGTGLGLSLSATIVKKHGGKIEFVSTQNVGSSFFVYLPIKQA